MHPQPLPSGRVYALVAGAWSTQRLTRCWPLQAQANLHSNLVEIQRALYGDVRSVAACVCQAWLASDQALAWLIGQSAC